MRRAFIVLNPAAGRGRGRALARDITDAIRAAGFDVTVGESRAPGDERRVAEEAVRTGWNLLVAAGGDGTVHGVANGLLRAERPATVGVVPIGTGNDFARLVGAPVGDLATAAEIVAQGTDRTFDVGRTGGEFFTNGLGVGFDTEVIRQMQRLPRLRGFALYLAAVYRTFFAFRPRTLHVTAAEHEEQGPLMLAEVSIGISAGGGFRLTPDADPTDGLFDVCLIRRVGLARFLWYVPRVITGTHRRLAPVTLFRSAHLTLETPGRPLVMHLDGELREPGGETITVDVVPRRLTVRCAAS
ncbi:MAG TPA: diacylglycerol kinase family protein [Gemmatimonadales bacterium]|nr:diacylglycerol kinase family protein [Gemmatimonadales bacterium]